MSEVEVKVAEIDRPLEKLGTLSFEHADNTVPDRPCDRLVYSNGIMLAASFVTSATEMKAIRAILYAKRGKVLIRCSNISAQYPSKTNSDYFRRFEDPQMGPDDKGYNLFLYKMDYGKVHATLISKDDNLLMYVNPESVWSRLMDSEYFQTPLLREWMPFVAGKLVEMKYLRECRCFRANAAVLDIKKVEQLDEIICEGLKQGYIQIP